MRTRAMLSAITVCILLNAQQAACIDFQYPTEDEWKAMSLEEKRAACHVPEDVLSAATTREVFDLCLDNPHLQNIIDWHGPARARFYFEGLSCLRELETRSDAAGYILEMYGDLVWQETSLLPRREWCFQDMRVWLLEYMLGRPGVIANMSSAEKEYLLHKIVDNPFRGLKVDAVPNPSACYLAGNLLLAVSDENMMQKAKGQSRIASFLCAEVDVLPVSDRREIISALSEYFEAPTRAGE